MKKTSNYDSRQAPADENRDPITGALGAHAVGTGIGATGGGLAGAAVGTVAGPIGTAVGLVAGAVAGGLAGKAGAEQIDPTVEDAYWKDAYTSRTYAEETVPYETYKPAYQLGYQGYSRYSGKTYDEAEPELRRDYEKSGGSSDLGWDKAKNATHDAWHRVERALPGDADNDGR